MLLYASQCAQRPSRVSILLECLRLLPMYMEPRNDSKETDNENLTPILKNVTSTRIFIKLHNIFVYDYSAYVCVRQIYEVMRYIISYI